MEEWKPCVKLPIVVHVREQREGETHISTREGLTPVLPDDLIMRGVEGEEYPIGREIFNRTYTFDTTPPMSKEQLFREIYKLHQEAEEYLNKLPDDIKHSGYIFDNGYTNPLMIMKDKLMEVAFGEHYQSIEWFLYDWQPGYGVGIHGVETEIHNIDDYITWMKLNEGFE